jgi:hypothetical protein
MGFGPAVAVMTPSKPSLRSSRARTLFADRPQVTVSAVNPLNRPTGSTNAKRSVMGEPGVAGGGGGPTLTAT